MAVPPGSPAALADQIGSTYHLLEAANGLSAWPLLVVVVELLLDELEDELLELDEELELLDDELLLEDEELELEELLLDELELLEDDELLELDEPEALIEPAEAVRVTLSSRAPSSRLTIRRVCAPAARLLKVAGVMVP
jgi:hypothetical protein